MATRSWSQYLNKTNSHKNVPYRVIYRNRWGLSRLSASLRSLLLPRGPQLFPKEEAAEEIRGLDREPSGNESLTQKLEQLKVGRVYHARTVRKRRNAIQPK